jgi:hypothetical protein
MQNIHVKRYADTNHGYQGTVEPEDRSWVLFLPKDGEPELFLSVETEDADGKTVNGYMPAIELARLTKHP